MAVTCSSQPIGDVIARVGSSAQHVFLADHDHENPAVYQTVTDGLPALAQLGVKHLFLEVPSLVDHLLEPGKRPLRDNPQAAESLKHWSIHTPELIGLVDEAHRNGMTVHFADDHVNMLLASRVVDEMRGTFDWGRLRQLQTDLTAIRSRVDPTVAAQIDAVNGKTATVYGSGHLNGKADINEMTSGKSVTLGIYSGTLNRVLENVGGLLLRNGVIGTGEDECVYARSSVTKVPAGPSAQR